MSTFKSNLTIMDKGGHISNYKSNKIDIARCDIARKRKHELINMELASNKR